MERAIGWKTAVSLGYVGNKGTHLFRSINANASYLGAGRRGAAALFEHLRHQHHQRAAEQRQFHLQRHGAGGAAARRAAA